MTPRAVSLPRRAGVGALAGLWAASVLVLYDLAAVGGGSLPWAGGWPYLGERILVGLLYYAVPFAAILATGGVLAALTASRGAAGGPPALGVSVAQAVTLALVHVAAGAISTRPGGARWLTAPWILEMLLVLIASCMAGWAAGRAVEPKAGRRRPPALLAVLAALPALPAMVILPGLLLAAAGSAPEPVEPRAAGRPHIVVIVADTLRADRVNGPRAPEIMPVVRGLASRGIRYEDATSQASWTNPSTATILTGLLPVDHGMRGYAGEIRDEARTMAEILRRFGYATAGITANPLVSAGYGFDRGFDDWDEEPERGLLPRHGSTFASRLRRGAGGGRAAGETMTAGEVTDRALEILDRPRERPLFLYLHYFDPHDPYTPPPDLEAGADPGYQGSLSFGRETLYRILRGEIEVTGRDIRHAAALYDAEITYMDREIGRLMERLEEDLEQGRVVVAFTSDHGEEFMEHGSLGHEHTLYQELIHIPLVVARPGHLQEGLVVREPVSHLDLLPTVLDAAGLPVPGGLPGRSLLAEGAPPPILSEEDYTGYRSVSHRMRSIREGSLKVISSSPNVFGIGEWRREIFDLDSDPAESAPLAGVDRLPEGMLDRLRAWRERSTEEAGEGRVLDPETEERLKALGYIE